MSTRLLIKEMKLQRLKMSFSLTSITRVSYNSVLHGITTRAQSRKFAAHDFKIDVGS
ncbi:hypothetical protein HanXRQr2_Chr03g0130241 [Helianthus annuus]|uniref:Uncharacterized protein n=1 Tax=Helianthus annuus TaxID=4232 RepID=A0A9K3NXG5_HELAN|nr:hypothetical protein HanXRQr2_Chr03g0130241 [Helianthus annuus]KAJ0945336.1 hypothetical protein HanPSC8_Chr03g0127061 [Helianthus annuus]